MAEFPFVFAQGEGPLLPPSAGHSPWSMPRTRCGSCCTCQVVFAEPVTQHMLEEVAKNLLDSKGR